MGGAATAAISRRLFSLNDANVNAEHRRHVGNGEKSPTVVDETRLAGWSPKIVPQIVP